MSDISTVFLLAATADSKNAGSNETLELEITVSTYASGADRSQNGFRVPIRKVRFQKQ